MLISFEHLLTFIDKPVHGILHVGAHLCEELQLYKRFLCDDIIWIEADPDTYSKAKESLVMPAFKVFQTYCTL